MCACDRPRVSHERSAIHPEYRRPDLATRRLCRKSAITVPVSLDSPYGCRKPHVRYAGCIADRSCDKGSVSQRERATAQVCRIKVSLIHNGSRFAGTCSGLLSV